MSKPVAPRIRPKTGQVSAARAVQLLATEVDKLDRYFTLTLAEPRGAGEAALARPIMRHLAHVGEHTVPQLARHLGVSRQHVQTVVNEMGALGWTESSRNPAHRRSVLIELTPLGQTLLQQANQAQDRRLERIGAVLKASDCYEAVHLLRRLRRALCANSEGEGRDC